MPIYEYACDGCGDEFEVEQRITDDPRKTCPSCKSRKVKRLISQTSFVLKGGGWYSDLYSSTKGKDKDKEKGTGGKSGGDDKNGGGGKSESKKGSKSDAKSSSGTSTGGSDSSSKSSKGGSGGKGSKAAA